MDFFAKYTEMFVNEQQKNKTFSGKVAGRLNIHSPEDDQLTANRPKIKHNERMRLVATSS